MKIPFSVRRVAERLSREVVLRRRLPERFGALPLFVSPGASMIYWRGLRLSAFDDLYDFAERYVRPGHTVWDIGSNVGLFAFSAAVRAGASGRVLCLEPDLWSVRLLRRSARLNVGRTASVDVLPVACGESLSIDWLQVPERSRASSHLAGNLDGADRSITGGVRERHLAPVLSLDWIAGQFPTPDVLKIDVDGGELHVLRGGKALLRAKRPIILTEVYERNADAVTALLHDLRYDLFQYERGEAGKASVARATYNTLAIPRTA
jgi:FkbM family methyltransferase